MYLKKVVTVISKSFYSCEKFKYSDFQADEGFRARACILILLFFIAKAFCLAVKTVKLLRV